MKKNIGNKIPKIGIQGKLTLIFILLSSIPLILASIYMVNQQVAVKEEENIREMGSDIKGLKERTSLFLTRIESEVSLVMKSTELKRFLKNLGDKVDIDNRLMKNVENEFINIVSDNEFYLKIDLYGKRGKELISIINDKNEPYAVPKESLSKISKNYYVQVVKEMKPGDIHLSPSEIRFTGSDNLEPVIDIVLPVYDDKGKISVIVTAKIRAENLFELLVPSYGNSPKKISIVNGEGYYIFHSERKNNWKSLFTDRYNENLFQDYSDEIANKILNDLELSTHYYRDRIIQFSPIFSGSKAVTNKYFIIEDVDADLVLSSIHEQKSLLVILIIAVGIVSLFVGYLTARQFLKPIKQLITGTQIIRGGNLDYKIEVNAKDEIQDLVENFNQLVLEWKNKQLLEKEIRKSEKLFSSLTQTATDAILGIDESGSITAWNHAASLIFGYSLEEAIGANVFLLIVPKRYRAVALQKLKELIRTAPDSFRGNTIEANALHKDGSEFPAELSVSIVVVDNVWYATGIVRDITERKRTLLELIEAKDKAEEMNRLKSSFLANMSHELRTPMIGILGFTEILKEDFTGSDYYEMVDAIHQSGNRLLNTLNLLLDLSRIEAKEEVVVFRDLEIKKILNPLVKSFEGAVQNKGLTVSLNISPENISASLDERIFVQVINNLLNNAIKFTSRGGITIDVNLVYKESVSWAEIKISDTGIGIARENLNLIFEEFRQESEGLSRRFEGTGLGLTITKKSVELMKGTINVESELGAGSTFTVCFPAADVNEIELLNEHEVPEMFDNRFNKNPDDRILLVENDRISLNYIQMLLKNHYIIDAVEDGRTALEYVSRNEYTLILMDIGLGIGLDGVEAAAEIRKLSNYAHVPIVAVTAYAMKGDKENYLSRGFTHYLSKPFKKIELLNLVKDILVT